MKTVNVVFRVHDLLNPEKSWQKECWYDDHTSTLFAVALDFVVLYGMISKKSVGYVDFDMLIDRHRPATGIDHLKRMIMGCLDKLPGDGHISDLAIETLYTDLKQKYHAYGGK